MKSSLAREHCVDYDCCNHYYYGDSDRKPVVHVSQSSVSREFLIVVNMFSRFDEFFRNLKRNGSFDKKTLGIERGLSVIFFVWFFVLGFYRGFVDGFLPFIYAQYAA